MKRTSSALLGALPFIPLLLAAAPLSAQTVLVAPYVQPGNGSTLEGTDVKVLTWLTDPTPGEFTVEYRPAGAKAWKTAAPVKTEMKFGLPTPKAPAAAPGTVPTTLEDFKKDAIDSTSAKLVEKEQHFLRYVAELNGLPFDSSVEYRVKMGAKVVREGACKTRASAGKPIRFVAVGDLAKGGAPQNAIAYQIGQQKPDFMVALGDIVYSSGRVNQYMDHFWTTYNDVAEPSVKNGAPIMASMPIYPVLGNHDIDAARLSEYPDAWGAYHFFNVPKSGPGTGPWSPKVSKDLPAGANFLAIAGEQFPAMLNYSFDYGTAHFLVLDCGGSVKADDPKLLEWIERDLSTSKQPWKFVSFHSPAFHTSREHYTEQKMRLWEPLFEKCKVDVVFAGHVHNYQRSKPLTFKPGPRNPKGGITGDFQLDETFDGVKDTTPEGVIHIVSGGGGAGLYSVDFAKTVAALKAEYKDNYVPFTANYYGTLQSFSLIELDAKTFKLRQINTKGEEVDTFSITKP